MKQLFTIFVTVIILIIGFQYSVEAAPTMNEMIDLTFGDGGAVKEAVTFATNYGFRIFGLIAIVRLIAILIDSIGDD